MSVNERLRDEVVAHLIDLHRFSNSEVRAMLSILRDADIALFNRLTAALANLSATEFTVQRLSSMLTGVWEANEAGYRQLATRTVEQMRSLTEYELEHQTSLFRDLLPTQVSVATVEPAMVYSAAFARPFRGRLLGEWFESLAAQRQQRIESTLRTGYVTGRTIDEMIRDIRGTRAQNYADGLIQIDRRNAEAVVRTSVAHFANFARQSFYKANADLIAEEQWASTLDNRTTEMCQIRDGLMYTAEDHQPVGHKVPWLEGPGMIHWGCRSTSVPVIDSAKELGLDLPPLERAEMNGVAAPGTTYRDWIERQPAARQDDILGPTRGALMRKGGLDFPDFFSEKGNFLTLDELRQREASAFRRAGV